MGIIERLSSATYSDECKAALLSAGTSLGEVVGFLTSNSLKIADGAWSNLQIAHPSGPIVGAFQTMTVRTAMARGEKSRALSVPEAPDTIFVKPYYIIFDSIAENGGMLFHEAAHHVTKVYDDQALATRFGVTLDPKTGTGAISAELTQKCFSGDQWK
ncbi:MAG: hypothetical protein L0387_19165 [Acidobacteria bacterium]|nr:hypothetical protein [Acidobacteriota bacterium]MCI0721116.1 hypothetical protein [Acidobacteriota bacterium]